jgi:hypothetical protein
MYAISGLGYLRRLEKINLKDEKKISSFFGYICYVALMNV